MARYEIPKKASVLWSLLVPCLAAVGMLPFTWVVPLILVSLTNEYGSASELPTDMGGWACSLPFGPEDGQLWYYLIVGSQWLVVALIGFAGVGALGRRLWIYLVVTRFGWLTLEEVKKFEDGHLEL